MAAPTLTANSPSAGYISWTSCNMQYGGNLYTIPAGNTNLKYVAWLYGPGALAYSNNAPINSATNAVASDWTGAQPLIGPDDLLLFVNKNGIPVNVQAAYIIDGDLVATGSIVSSNLYAGTIQSQLIQTTNLATDSITANLVLAGAIGTSELASNSIIADRIAAGAVTAEKLTIGSLGNNLILNPTFEDVTSTGALANWRYNWTGSTGAVGSSTTTIIDGARSATITVDTTAAYGDLASAAFPVVGGQTYYVKTLFATSVNAMPQSLYVYFGKTQGFAYNNLATGVPTIKNTHVTDAAGNDLTIPNPTNAIAGRARLITSWAGSVANNVYTMSGQVVVPTDATWAVVMLQSLGGVAGTVYWDDVECDGVIISAVIGDGAITANKISAGAIDGKTITGATVQTAASGVRVQIGPSDDTIRFWSGLASETVPGEIYVGNDVTGTVYTGKLIIKTPELNNQTSAMLTMYSESSDGLTPQSAWFNCKLDANSLQVDGSSVLAGSTNINVTPLFVNQDVSTHRMHVIQATSGNSSLYLDCKNPSGTSVAMISSTGNVQGTGSYTPLSDRTVKNSIKYLKDGNAALEQIGKLRPAKFRYNDQDEYHLGFIAQDVQKVLPDAVVPWGEPHDESDLEDGTTHEGSGLLGLRTDAILATLVTAVQELTKRVDGLTQIGGRDGRPG